MIELNKNNSMRYILDLFANQYMKSTKQIGNYLICDICGIGSNGIVYVVKNTNNNRKYAFKLLNLSYYIIDYFHLDYKNFHETAFEKISYIKNELINFKFTTKDYNKLFIQYFKDKSEENSFKREFYALSSIPRNKKCVFIEDYGYLKILAINETNKYIHELPYVVMPIFNGIVLTDYIENERNFLYDYKTIFSLLKKMTNIIEFIHKNKIIHRDLYPNNFLYNEQTKELFLLDFGSSIYNKDFSIDTIGERRGSRRFMSPEQFDNPQFVDERSDYFFIGSTLFYMLTKKYPFSRERDQYTHPINIKQYFKPNNCYNIYLYNKILYFSNKLLEYDKNDRFQNLLEIEKSINEILKIINKN